MKTYDPRRSSQLRVMRRLIAYGAGLPVIFLLGFVMWLNARRFAGRLVEATFVRVQK